MSKGLGESARRASIVRLAEVREHANAIESVALTFNGDEDKAFFANFGFQCSCRTSPWTLLDLVRKGADQPQVYLKVLFQLDIWQQEQIRAWVVWMAHPGARELLPLFVSRVVHPYQWQLYFKLVDFKF